MDPLTGVLKSVVQARGAVIPAEPGLGSRGKVADDRLELLWSLDSFAQRRG